MVTFLLAWHIILFLDHQFKIKQFQFRTTSTFKGFVASWIEDNTLCGTINISYHRMASFTCLLEN